jgi:peptidoglycan/xylan/chitin deacetylase (PgdA/CDA1 family)
MNKFLFKSLKYLGLASLFRLIFQRDKITILLFHDIDATTAMQTFKYLSSKYNIIDLDTYITAQKMKDYSSIPKYAMIITFDDGHIQNHSMIPAIERYNIPITIFLCSSIVGTHRHFWFLHGLAELKKEENKTRLERLEERGFAEEREYKNPVALTKEQIKQMSKSKYINFQSHTLFHPILPKCSDSDARREIIQSKEILEQQYNLKINAIAYPNGDYSSRDIEIAKEAKYKCAITVDFGFNTLETDIFRLKRVSVNDKKDMSELIVKASGLWAFLKTRNGKKQSYGFTESVKNYTL